MEGETRDDDRDRSPEKEDEEYINFKEVMEIIAARFPSQFSQEPQKLRMAGLTEAQFDPPKQEPTKIPPWSTGFEMV